MTPLKTLSNNAEKFQTLDDADLLHLIITSKNILFFDILLTRYQGVVYNKILGFIDREQEAIELTKTLFVVLFSEIHLYKGPYDFSVWLYERTYRLCINYLSTIDEVKRKSELENQLVGNLLIQVSDDVLYRMNVKKLRKALSLIEPEDKAILMLKYQDEVSIDYLALLLRIDEDSVTALLRKAKVRIVEVYNEL